MIRASFNKRFILHRYMFKRYILTIFFIFSLHMEMSLPPKGRRFVQPFKIARGFVRAQGSFALPLLIKYAFIIEFITRLNSGPNLSIIRYCVNNTFSVDGGQSMTTRDEEMHERLRITDEWAGETEPNFEPTKMRSDAGSSCCRRRRETMPSA